MVVSMMVLGNVDVTVVTCSTKVLFELLIVSLSVTTVVMLDRDFVEVNCSDAVVVFCGVWIVVSIIGRVDVDATVALCSKEVIIAGLYELLMVDLSVTIVVMLDPDFMEVNCCDAAVVVCSVDVVISVVGRIDVDVTTVICSVEVVFARTEVMLDPDFFVLNCSDAVTVFSAV